MSEITNLNSISFEFSEAALAEILVKHLPMDIDTSEFDIDVVPGVSTYNDEPQAVVRLVAIKSSLFDDEEDDNSTEEDEGNEAQNKPKKRRKRRTKEQIEADRLAEAQKLLAETETTPEVVTDSVETPVAEPTVSSEEPTDTLVSDVLPDPEEVPMDTPTEVVKPTDNIFGSPAEAVAEETPPVVEEAPVEQPSEEDTGTSVPTASSIFG